MDKLDLGELLTRCQAGDGLAWEALVRLYQGRVYGMAYHWVGNSEDARDLAQEVFVRVYRNLDLCLGPQHFLPWLARITRNACIDHSRRMKVRPNTSELAAEVTESITDSGQTPEEITESKSRRGLLTRALRRLTQLNREIIILKDIQGLSLGEIARILEVPVGTIKSRSHRARLELAQHVTALAGRTDNFKGA